MTYYFVEKPEVIRAWLANKGYFGSLYDALHAYFQTKSDTSDQSLHDLINFKMTALGYTGNLQAKLRQFFKVKMNEPIWPLAERLFWRDLTTDFELIEADSSGGIVDGDGNILVDGDGNIIVGG